MSAEIRRRDITMTIEDHEHIPGEVYPDDIHNDFRKYIDEAVQKYYDKNKRFFRCPPDVI